MGLFMTSDNMQYFLDDEKLFYHSQPFLITLYKYVFSLKTDKDVYKN